MASTKVTKAERAVVRREFEAWLALKRLRLAEQIRKLRAGLKLQIKARRAELVAMARAPKKPAKRPAKKATRAKKKPPRPATRAKSRAKKKPPRPATLLESLAPEQQAQVIIDAAERAEPFIEGSRRFIASVWDVLRRERRSQLELPAFKALLLRLQHADLVRLTRLDLVGAAEKRGQRGLLERSTTERAGIGGHVTEYHLVALGAG